MTRMMIQAKSIRQCRRRRPPRRPMVLPSSMISILSVLLLGLTTIVQNVAAQEREEDEEKTTNKSGMESWQENYLYMAPTSNGKGWGLFAAKSFQTGDVIEVSPMWLSFEVDEAILYESIFEDYHMHRWEWDGHERQYKLAYVLGPSHMLNSGPEEDQNTWIEQFGDGVHAVAFGLTAIQDIAVGDELLTDYGSDWFIKRGMHHVLDKEDPPLGDTTATHPNTTTTTKKGTTPWINDETWREVYTSKIYTGHGRDYCTILDSSVLDNEERGYDMKSFIQNRLAPWEAGYRDARAKVPIDQAGTLLEIIPAHVMAKNKVLGTLLEPLVVFWNDLEPSSLLLVGEEKDSHLPETVRVLFKYDQTLGSRQRLELNRVEETVLLPLGGSLVMLDRTTSEDPNEYNCRLEGIIPDRWNEHAFTIRIVSTRPIEVGSRLVLKMAGISSSPETRHALWQQLVATKQPFTPGLEHNFVDPTEDELDTGGTDSTGDEDTDIVNQAAEL